MVGSILVVGTLIHLALLHCMCGLKAAQKNVQCSLIQELRFYVFKLGYNTTEATKNIGCTEGSVDHSIVTR